MKEIFPINNMDNKSKGFTLIELMIVVVIIGIFSAIAYPSYTEHVNKARRAEAQTALLQGAQELEKYYSANGRYTAAAGGTTLPTVYPTTAGDGGNTYYTLAASTVINPSATTFVLVATRANIMTSDKCGDFQIDQAGQLSVVTGTSDVANADSYCLRQ
jgi:type IV pilus assembly protein PilE